MFKWGRRRDSNPHRTANEAALAPNSSPLRSGSDGSRTRYLLHMREVPFPMDYRAVLGLDYLQRSAVIRLYPESTLSTSPLFQAVECASARSVNVRKSPALCVAGTRYTSVITRGR